MDETVENTFDHISKTPRGHFTLYFYAVVFRLIKRIQLLSQVGGASLEDVFKRYPFLSGYYNEILGYMPNDINWHDAIDWWSRSITAWEKTCDVNLPIKLLKNCSSLSLDGRLAFIATGLVEEDSRFGTVFAELQAPLNQRRPTLEFIGQMILSGQEANVNYDAWSLCRSLVDMNLVEVLNDQAPRSEWLVRVPSQLWDAARGEVNERPADWCHFYYLNQFPDIGELIFPDDVLERFRSIPQLISQSKVNQLVLRSGLGGDTIEVMGALAKSIGLNLIVVKVSADAKAEISRLLGSLCSMSHSLPVLQYETAPGDTIKAPLLSGYHGPVCFILGLEGGIESFATGKILTITLEPPDKALRERYWQRALNGITLDDIGVIADMFRVSGGYIKELATVAVANAGLNGRDSLQLKDIQEASRALNRQHLDTLADRLTTQGNWNELVVTASTGNKLLELQRRCRYRESLNSHLGQGFGNSANQGVRALFTGASGTGKTLAAKILAAELGMDLYRVDLAAVINKYIGETEKNLHHVLTQAEALDVILLLDEGDALLGGRTDVKSANDRYANLETNYLLQRLENYQGIILITSNLVENIDRAFQRRMDVLVQFYSPQAEQRLQIIELHLPADHQVDYDYLQQVAIRSAFNGGQIRNASLYASLLAMEEGCPVNRYHLEESLKSEFRKAGAISPFETGKNNVPSMKGSMDTFISALIDHQ